jgi:hypothetical protein
LTIVYNSAIIEKNKKYPHKTGFREGKIGILGRKGRA